MRSVDRSTANPSQKLIRLFRTLSAPHPFSTNHDDGEDPQAVMCNIMDRISVY